MYYLLLGYDENIGGAPHLVITTFCEDVQSNN